MTPAELHPSKLGTKDHWEKVYQEELANFDEIGDEGEVWFGLETVDKMVEWTVNNFPPQNMAILDVGSGNGALLFALMKAGFPAKQLAGIDYCADATKLAQSIAKTNGGGEITFGTCDFLREDPPSLHHTTAPLMSGCWDLITDKGTYDAIALGQKDEQGRSPAIGYPIRVSTLLKCGGYFLITSCNFTEDELRASFTTPETGLVYHSRIQHPTFTFGGRSGSICSSIAVQKL